LQLRVDTAEERHRLTEPGAMPKGLGFDFALGPSVIVVGKVLSDSAADEAGLERGDVVRALDGREPKNADDFVAQIRSRPGDRVELRVERDRSEHALQVRVRAEQDGGKTIGRIGAEMGNRPLAVSLERLGPVSALGRAVGETWEMSQLTVTMLWNMVMGRVSVKNISGPINIAAFAGETARIGVRPFLTFLAIVSISLGVLNLLPIPILDGGQMVFQAIEAVKGSPLSERAQIVGQQVGIALLLILMSLAFYNDISSRLH
jgi:regulator of sigma E protease